MTRPWAFASLLAVALGIGLAAPAQAQIYRWTNDQGEVSITEGLSSVPERFRGRAVLLGYPPVPPAGTAAPPTSVAAVMPDSSVLARVPYVQGLPIVVLARINGGRNVQLVLDTGADRTMISPEALGALGVDMRPVRRGTVRSVTGTSEVETVVVQSLEVGDAKVGPLEVLAYNPRLTRGEGLLGRDVLELFMVSIDSRAQEVVFRRR
jgi:aspartyl protease/uncharacterized protein DUF4124